MVKYGTSFFSTSRPQYEKNKVRVDQHPMSLTRKSGSSQTIHTYKPFWFTWMDILKCLLCHDILILGKSPIKWRQHPDMTIAVDWDVKHQFKQIIHLIKLSLYYLIQSFFHIGQERFTSMTRVYYKDAHACIVMFDLTQRLTFQNAVKWKKDLDAKCTLQDGSPVPCLLLANKVRISKMS